LENYKIEFDEIKLILIQMEKSTNAKLQSIEKKLDELDKKIEKNENQLTELKTSLKKMDNHINFVENTYEKLRNPLGFLKRNVERFIGYSHKEELPAVSTENASLPAPQNNQ
jgi:chromosome segregation ATPase